VLFMPKTSSLPANLTIEEAAEHWRTSRHALYSQIQRGNLPGSLGRRVGRRYLFTREAVEHFDRTGQALNGKPRGK
jgi:excisionase family DNA binding protein